MSSHASYTSRRNPYGGGYSENNLRRTVPFADLFSEQEMVGVSLHLQFLLGDCFVLELSDRDLVDKPIRSAALGIVVRRLG
jgi:hypothetical protein